ncbi:MAG TPA: prepilin peptidase [Actinomycetota bacterium]|nr:prepilin peptidase [Actinomycetota bacterium]
MIPTAAVVLGLLIGSFLNVVIHRVPRKLSLVSPASACPSCSVPVRPRDNVPVVSYLFLRGRCRACAARIPLRYPLVEAMTALLFLVAVIRAADLETAAFLAAAGSVLIALSFIDLDHRRVPNVIVLPATTAAVVWVAAGAVLTGDTSPLVSALISATAGFVLLLLIALVSGGMGMGDVKLAAFIGVVSGRFGVGAFAVALFSGFMIGGLVAVVLLVVGRAGRKTAIPFAPMLCLGGLIGMFAGRSVFEFWAGV